MDATWRRTEAGGGEDGDAQVHAGTLAALASAFPYPAYLFEADGRLLWWSDEGAARTGPAAATWGAAAARAPILEAARRLALAGLDGDGPAAERALRRAGLLRAGERPGLRRLEERGRPLVLVTIAPALAPERHPAHLAPGAAAAVIPGLSACESRVARLAVEGFTVTNIAAHLGVAEATVRTHLRRLYRKLRVHGRAELACLLMRGPTSRDG